MNEEEYYLLIDGETHGPFTLEQLQEMWFTKGIPLDTLYAKPGLKEVLPFDTLLHKIIAHKKASDLAKAPPKPPRPVPTRKWAPVYVIILSLVVAFFWSIGPFFRKFIKPPNVVTASVQASAINVIISNNDDYDWTEKVVSLNDLPPDGYQWKLDRLTAGKTITISLIEFRNPQGERFQPWNMTVRDVWLGGGGKDFERFRMPLK